MADQNIVTIMRNEFGELQQDDFDADQSDSDADDEYMPENESDTPSEDAALEEEISESDTHSVSDDDEENPGEDSEVRQFEAKDGTIWFAAAPRPAKTPGHNVVKGRVRVVRNAGQLENPIQALDLYVNDRILNWIVLYTNREAERIYQVNNVQKAWKPCDKDEIRAFIGLVLAAGLHKAKHLTCEMLWNPKHGPTIFRATMGLTRFKALLSFLRFDDKETRSHRREKDKLAPIRDVFDELNLCLLRYYVPSEYLTVDEQLVPFRGRCSFKQYMPSKPDKYGLKIWWIACAKTFYPLQGKAYLGKEGNRAESGLGKRVVLELSEPFSGTGRNITCDNYFTDLDLAMELLQKKLTLVGTVRKNKRFIPKEFLPHRQREENSSIFGFQEKHTLVSYVPKKNKAVVLLSSMHHTNDIVVEDSRKPEIIKLYNEKKGGVDSLDQLVHAYMSKRRSNRWPMAFFFNLLDVAGVAAFVVWMSKNPDWMERKHYKRRLFLEEVTEQLVRPHILRRSENLQGIQKEIVAAMECMVGPIGQMPPAAEEQSAKSRCYLCPRSKDKKVKATCAVCDKHVCPKHSKKSLICKDCE